MQFSGESLQEQSPVTQKGRRYLQRGGMGDVALDGASLNIWLGDRTGQDHGHPARVGGERQHMPHHLARAVLFWGTDITPSCLKSCG